MAVAYEPVDKRNGYGQVPFTLAPYTHNLDVLASLRKSLFELDGVHVLFNGKDNLFSQGEGRKTNCGRSVIGSHRVPVEDVCQFWRSSFDLALKNHVTVWFNEPQILSYPTFRSLDDNALD